MKRLALLALLPLATCGAYTKDLGNAGKAPGMYFCAGQASISTIGQIAIYGANGNITFNCGNGAYFGQGYPTGPLPTLPQASSPNIPNFPPLGQPPTQ